MELDELQHALGGVVLEAAYLERVLRAAFSALVGSKYTAAVDGRLMAHALIEDCQHIARVHRDIAEPEKATLTRALNECDAANKKRNRVIHDAWRYRTGDVMAAAQTSDGRPAAALTVAELHQLAAQISEAADNLAAAVTDAVGPESMRIEDQLALELAENDNAGTGTR